MKQAEIIESIVNSIPYPQHIKNIDLTEGNAVLFDWRGSRYRVGSSLDVEECEGGFLCGSDKAILMRHVIAKGRTLSALDQ